MVVDDNEAQRFLVAKALLLNGYQVHEAGDGQAALEAVEKGVPDLILSDIEMPRMGGYELLQRLRSQLAWASIPVILMTGRADNEGMRRGMNLGADDYLPKPFGIPDVLAAIESRLEKVNQFKVTTEKNLDALRSQITLMLPHELLTPLNGILGIAELLASESSPPSAEDLVEYGEMLKQSGKRLHRLVLNFLAYAQVELMATDPTARESLLANSTENAVKLITDKANAVATHYGRAADLNLVLSPMSIPMADMHLEKLVEELLDNAFKFSGKGAPVTLSLFSIVGQTHLKIADRGSGMNADELDKIGAYQQFNRKIQEQQGSGLGLAIARRLVDLHGGVFGLRNRQGGGLSVLVTFPG